MMSKVHLFLQVQRKQVEFHLQSAVRLHLDLSCIKLNDTEAKLIDTEMKLIDTEMKLNDTEAKLNKTEVKLNNTAVRLNSTEVKLNDTQKKLEATTKLVEEFNTRMFIWKIDNFSEILRQAKTGEKTMIEGTPFYTDRTERNGYKLKVNIHPNGKGIGENTHLSVYIFVMKGEYDAILPWPFKKKVKFTLIDQQEDPLKRKNDTGQFTPGITSESFARPTREENRTGWGFPEFISHKKLHSRRYLVDDTLFLQVEIGP